MIQCKNVLGYLFNIGTKLIFEICILDEAQELRQVRCDFGQGYPCVHSFVVFCASFMNSIVYNT